MSASSISGPQSTMTPEQVSENLAAISAERVTEIVLITESTDHLAVRGRDQLQKDKTLFEELRGLPELS